METTITAAAKEAKIRVRKLARGAWWDPGYKEEKKKLRKLLLRISAMVNGVLLPASLVALSSRLL